MNYSLGELEALCRKATRGAGFSWGIAEDAGKTVRWLSSWNLPGATALAAYLHDRKDATGPDDPTLPDWSSSKSLCPLVCGTLISDLGGVSADQRLHRVAWPILLFSPWVQDMSILWDNTSITLDGDVTVNGTPLTSWASTVSITRKHNVTGKPNERVSRADLAAEDLTLLVDFASRTYAPETEASKHAGAGAGPGDED